MPAIETNTSLFEMLDRLNQEELNRLAATATLSSGAIRRRQEQHIGHRQNFALDADRILHSRAYTRYIDKTQVFCLISNDHITHRVLHVQLVSRIARTIGRFLRLNEDLIEAIALGHDIGHPPFGHDGEQFLSEICQQYGLPSFQHNIQSVRFLDQLERKGRGWNLTLQTLDGILCHDGERHISHLTPTPEKDFAAHNQEMHNKEKNPSLILTPMSLEGCVVRMADTIAYIGRDIEDAIVLGLIKREDLPVECTDILGNTNGSIVYALVTDMICNSQVTPDKDTDNVNGTVGFSLPISSALNKLKQFNYQHIYLHPKTKTNLPLIQTCYQTLFTNYVSILRNDIQALNSQTDLMTDIKISNRKQYPPEAMARDFIAGMTDDFFLKQAALAGCRTPEKQ